MKYNAVEVQGCVELGDGVIEPVQGDDKPTMYCVFGHMEGGGLDWLSDHRDHSSAIYTARNISEQMNIPMYSFTEEVKT